jgi:hypothetical protein
MFPIINAIVQKTGMSAVVLALMGVQLSLAVAIDFAFGMYLADHRFSLRYGLIAICVMVTGSIFLYISAASPNKQSLGATNGLAQLAASIVRTIGPTLSTSLFAASVQHNWLGGSAVYVVMICLAWVSLLVGRKLPPRLWNED